MQFSHPFRRSEFDHPNPSYRISSQDTKLRSNSNNKAAARNGLASYGLVPKRNFPGQASANTVSQHQMLQLPGKASYLLDRTSNETQSNTQSSLYMR
jgi:hypothetical protein